MRNLIVVVFVLSCSSCQEEFKSFQKDLNTHKVIHRRLDTIATYVAPTNSVVGNR